MSNNLVRITVLTMDKGGDGRFRPGTTCGLVDVDNISSAREFYHGELGKTCSRLLMKSGETVEVLGSLDSLLSKEIESGLRG